MHQPVNPTNALSQLVHAVTLRGIYYKYIHYVGGASRRLDGVHAYIPPAVFGAKATSLGGQLDSLYESSASIVSRLTTFLSQYRNVIKSEPSRRDTTRIALDPYSTVPIALSDLRSRPKDKK
ncbi:hypothetical protein V500_08343 [Pseudogymnoascus sp. VKM F-4518 (FW-2643)]|nr:hypothetical protein V500_08343 [Pseudogymnoascus sp. VKM F-4518 (FW-2643)]